MVKMQEITHHELIIAIEEEVQKGSNVTNGNQQILWIIDSIEHLLFQSGLRHVLPLFSNVRKTSYTTCYRCWCIMSKIYVLSHFHCCSVSLAWWNTFHSELVIHLHRHPSIYIGFLFYCMSPKAKGCKMKLLSFCTCCGKSKILSGGILN